MCSGCYYFGKADSNSITLDFSNDDVAQFSSQPEAVILHRPRDRAKQSISI
jgi:hypothetical protein